MRGHLWPRIATETTANRMAAVAAGWVFPLLAVLWAQTFLLPGTSWALAGSFSAGLLLLAYGTAQRSASAAVLLFLGYAFIAAVDVQASNPAQWIHVLNLVDVPVLFFQLAYGVRASLFSRKQILRGAWRRVYRIAPFAAIVLLFTTHSWMPVSPNFDAAFAPYTPEAAAAACAHAAENHVAVTPLAPAIWTFLQRSQGSENAWFNCLTYLHSAPGQAPAVTSWLKQKVDGAKGAEQIHALAVLGRMLNTEPKPRDLAAAFGREILDRADRRSYVGHGQDALLGPTF